MVRLPGRRWRRVVSAAVAMAVLCPTAPSPLRADGGPVTTALVAVTPCRLLDTRTDASAAGPAPLAVPTLDRCGIPAEATAVAITVATWSPTADGSLVAWPAGPAPAATSMVYRRGGQRTAAAVVPVDQGGFLVAATSTVEVTVDVTAAFVPASEAAGGRYSAITPARALDTRRTGRPAAGAVLAVPLPAAVPPDARAVLATITLASSVEGSVSAFPGTTPPGTVSVLADEPWQTRTVQTVVPITPDGFSVQTSAANHVVVDVVGWFTGDSAEVGTAGLYLPASPTRRVDTRRAAGDTGGPKLFDRGTREWAVTPADPAVPVAAALVGLTVIDSEGPGWWSVLPAGGGTPQNAVAIDAPYQSISGSVVAPLSTAGLAVRAAAQGGHLTLDVLGWFVGTPAAPLGLAATNAEPPPVAPPVTPCQRMRNGAQSYWNSTVRTPDRQVVIGTSVRGRPIIAEHWGSNEGPQVLAVTQVHGSECSMAAFGAAVRVNPPRDYGIWLIPTLNPDGSLAGSRVNAQGIDLNRDGYTAVAPETKALMAFTVRIRPALTLHFHEPEGWIGYTVRGSRSDVVATAMARGTALSVAPAGARSRGWFLWQGQAWRLRGHQSVLVEMPGLLGGTAPYGKHWGPTAINSLAATLLRQLSVVVRT